MTDYLAIDSYNRTNNPSSWSPAEVYYKPSPADVAQPFTGQLFVKAFFPPSNSNLDEVVYDPIPFTITAS